MMARGGAALDGIIEFLAAGAAGAGTLGAGESGHENGYLTLRESEMTAVKIECAGLSTLAAFPSIHKTRDIPLSDKFMATTATVPSGFKKAVVLRSSWVEELMMRLAPGRMNFEK